MRSLIGTARFWHQLLRADMSQTSDNPGPGHSNLPEEQNTKPLGEQEIEYLRKLIGFDKTDEHVKLEGKIVQAQREERSVLRAVSLMGLLFSGSAVALLYGAVLQDSFLFREDSDSTLRLILVFGLASLISLLVFLWLLMNCRRKLTNLRAECLYLATKIMAARQARENSNPPSKL